MIELITSKEIEEYLLIEASGTIENIEDWKELDRQIGEIIMKSEFNKIILDERDVIHKNNVFMIVELVKNMIDNLPHDLRSRSLAVIVNSESKEIADFWETYSVNRGYNWRAYTNFDEAMAFLNDQ